MLALYNAAGPGQSLPAGAEEAIRAIQRPVQMQVFVSLSCTMCPELVAAAQRIASLNPLVSAEAYDLNHFPSLRDQYEVMSVPCLIIGSGKPVSAKKISSSCWISSKNMHKYPSGDRKPVLFLSLRRKLSTGARPFLWKKYLTDPDIPFY